MVRFFSLFVYLFGGFDFFVSCVMIVSCVKILSCVKIVYALTGRFIFTVMLLKCKQHFKKYP